MTPTLSVLGSGSRGNAVAVGCDGRTLLLDAGFSARDLERRAAQLQLDLATTDGIVLTHEHGDHARGALRLARTLRCPVIASPGTWGALADGADGIAFRPLGAAGAVEVGPFTVHAAPTSHDAAEPLAIAVAMEGGRVGYATDLGVPTAGLRWLFRDLTALVLEANHDEQLLRTSGYPPVVQQRIAGSGGHLSNAAAAALLGEVAHPGLAVVVLAHLSERCNTLEMARATVEPALRRARFRGTLHVACQDEPIGPLALRAPAEPQLRMAL